MRFVRVVAIAYGSMVSLELNDCKNAYDAIVIGITESNCMNNETWMCLICGWMYDEQQGAPDDGIAAGTKWADVPMNWVCPECGARKEDFEMVQI